MDIDTILAQLTLQEKADLCSGADFWHTKSLDRFGLPRVMMCDGPHGLLGRAGSALGQEARSEGVAMLLGPGVNIKRSPLCGRNFECFSEDPYLSSELAAAFIQGMQNEGVAACVKHFAANNQETLRMTSDSVVDERTLQEIYLASFEGTVKKGQPESVMCAYNKINGFFAAESHELLTAILRKQWGFDGFVVTDWGAVKDRVAGLQAVGSTGPKTWRRLSISPANVPFCSKMTTIFCRWLPAAVFNPARSSSCTMVHRSRCPGSGRSRQFSRCISAVTASAPQRLICFSAGPIQAAGWPRLSRCVWPTHQPFLISRVKRVGWIIAKAFTSAIAIMIKKRWTCFSRSVMD